MPVGHAKSLTHFWNVSVTIQPGFPYELYVCVPFTEFRKWFLDVTVGFALDEFFAVYEDRGWNRYIKDPYIPYLLLP